MTQLKLLSESEDLKFFGHLPRPDAPLDYAPPVHFPDIFDAKQITIDLETHEPDQLKNGPAVRTGGHIVGIGIQVADFKEYYPMRHVNGPNCNPEFVLDWLKKGFQRFKGELVGANVVSYDADYLQHAGIHIPNCHWRDVQWAEALLDEYSVDNGLDALSFRYLGIGKEVSAVEKLYGPEFKKHFREVHPAHGRDYVLGDVDRPPRILELQQKELSKQGLSKLFDLECRLAPMLLYMKRLGVRVDLDKAEKLRRMLDEKITENVKFMQEMVGFPVNFKPSKSFERAVKELGIPFDYTEKGNPSFNKDWMKRNAHNDETADDCFCYRCPSCFLRLAMEARQYETLKNTFVDGYVLNGHVNGRIHAQFHPLKHVDEENDDEGGTVTGRLSSSNPNLQNIPRRTKVGKMLRELFIPEEGAVWWSKDYSQYEFRALVHYAIKAKCTGADVAQRMYREKPKTDFHQMVVELTDLIRDDAKNCNFAIVYGAGRWKTALMMNLLDAQGKFIAVPHPETGNLVAAVDLKLEKYHTKVPFAKEIANIASEQAAKKGFVRTVLGRRGRFPFWEPKYWDYKGNGKPEAYLRERALEVYGPQIRRAQTHKALNKSLQGTNADEIKQALVNIWEAGLLKDDSLNTLAITVHDENNGSADPGESGRKFLSQVQELMETAIPLEVPVLVDGKTGRNWAEAK